MITKYFYDIIIKRREQEADDLGGMITTYKTIGTVKGLLERSSSTERLIAAQRGVSDVYVFMVDKTNTSLEIATGDILSGNNTTAIITSSQLDGQEKSEAMKNIAQWTAESYIEVAE